MSGLKPRRAAATTTSNRLSGTPRSGQAVLETFIVVGGQPETALLVRVQ